MVAVGRVVARGLDEGAERRARVHVQEVHAKVDLKVPPPQPPAAASALMIVDEEPDTG